MQETNRKLLIFSINCHTVAAGISKTLRKRIFFNNTCSQSKILFKSTKKVIPVAVVKKNILAIQTHGDDIINRTGHIKSSVLRHATMIAIRKSTSIKLLN